MTPPDRRTLEAMSSLQGDPDFEIFMAWLAASRDEQVNKALVEREDVLSRWAQGAAQELREITRTVGSAREVIHKLTANTA